MARKADVTWREIDAATLPKALTSDYAAYQTAAEMAAEARDEFNGKLEKTLRGSKAVTDEQDVLISHQWGKLSYGLTKRDPTKPSKVRQVPLKLS